mgnify:CR=1 FL=1
MSVSILLIGAPLSRNLGGPSLLLSTRKVLDSVFPGTRYTYISPLAEDLSLEDVYDMEIITTVPMKELVVAALAKRLFGLTVGSPSVRRALRAYSESDLVVDIWGIGFSDTISKRTFRSSVLSGGRFLVGRILGKRVVKYTADLGPFDTRWNRFFSKWYFNHTVDLILARSESTRQRLLQLGVKTPIKVCPDTAFLLPAERSPFSEGLVKRRQEGRPIVGFSVSHMAARQSGDWARYIEQVAHLADHVVKTTGAEIVFIPNELSPDVSADDVHFSQLVLDAMQSRDKAVIAPTADLTAPQVKGVIGQCDVVVASRYHTIVAALSQAIPTLAIGWHAKYEGVMSLVGQEEFVCHVRSMTLDDLKTKFTVLWNSRHEIRAKIQGALPTVEQRIWQCAREVSNLLDQGAVRRRRRTRKG